MPLTLSVPTGSSWTTQVTELGNVSYTFVYSINPRYTTRRMYLDIFLDETPVKTGIKLMSNITLLPYLLTTFDHGQLFCIKLGAATDTSPTLGNIGLGLDYELIYYTNEELLALA